jgi:adenosine deaminase
LPREYEIARATYGWTEDVLRDLARTSIEASFAGRDIKEKMRGNLSEWGTGLETFEEKRS